MDRVTGVTSRSMEEPQAILLRRAEELARPPPRTEASGQTLRLVELSIAGERYGVESRLVREVTQLRRVTPVPCTPSFVLGVINVRGHILSVLNPVALLELPIEEHSRALRAVVLHLGRMDVGLAVDEVLGVRELASGELLPVPAIQEGTRGRYLKGVTSDRLIVLDGERLLSDDRLIVREQVDGEKGDWGRSPPSPREEGT